MPKIQITSMNFESNIINIYGDRGKTWLKSLLDIVNAMAEKYNLSKLILADNLSYNYVLKGVREDSPVILKLGLDVSGLKQEYVTLKAFSGFGAIEVLAAEDGMLLMEQAISGQSLKSYFSKNDFGATIIACNLMQRLHQAPIPESRNFPHINGCLTAIDNDHGIPTQYISKALELCDQLTATSE